MYIQFRQNTIIKYEIRYDRFQLEYVMVGIFTSFETFIVGICNDVIIAIITKEGHIINLSF